MSTKRFHLGAVLSVTTGRLLCQVDGLYEILNWMTGDNLFTHQLPRAADECKPWILRRHPQLVGVDASGVTKENWQQFLGEQVKQHGEYFDIEPIPRDDHIHIDPIKEACDLFGEGKVIIVLTPAASGEDSNQ